MVIGEVASCQTDTERRLKACQDDQLVYGYGRHIYTTNGSHIGASAPGSAHYHLFASDKKPKLGRRKRNLLRWSIGFRLHGTRFKKPCTPMHDPLGHCSRYSGPQQGSKLR